MAKTGQGPRDNVLRISVGDVVRWGSRSTIGVVQAIRVISSGHRVPSFCGERGEIVLTISDGVGTAFVVPEEGAISHVERDEAASFLTRMRRDGR